MGGVATLAKRNAAQTHLSQDPDKKGNSTPPTKRQIAGGVAENAGWKNTNLDAAEDDGDTENPKEEPNCDQSTALVIGFIVT